MKAALIVVAGITLVLSASAASAPASSAQAEKECAPGAEAARIGGRAVCLRERGRCDERFNRQYRRYGLACLGDQLWARWSVLRRPLHVPKIAADATCPTSTKDPRDLASVAAWGDGVPAWGLGPAYPILSDLGRPVLRFAYPPPPEFGTEWGVAKFPWFTARSYRGRILVRGRQLDGPNEIRFVDGRPGFTPEKNRNPVGELQLEDDAAGHPSLTRLRAEGCYAYQVDGWRLSRLIVFEAVIRAPSP